MVRAGLLIVALSAVVACQKSEPPPPASGQPAPRGVPPPDPNAPKPAPAPAPPAADKQGLPPNHPPVEGRVADQPSPHGTVKEALPGGPELTGEISVDPKLAAEVKAGDTIFLIARTVDGTGQVQKTALAATRVEVGELPVKFKLDASNVMAANSDFAGEVELTARVDRDHEAMTRAAGDLEGTTKAKIPAADVKIVLDTKVQP